MMNVVLDFASVVFLLLAYLAEKYEFPPSQSLAALTLGVILLCRRIWSEVSSSIAKKRAKIEQDSESETDRAMSQRLDQMIDKVNEFHARLCASCRNTFVGTEMAQLSEERDLTTAAIEEWKNATILELNMYRNGWGGRFRAIGIPNPLQCDSGHHGRPLQLIGELALYREKLAELLADIGRK